MHENQRAYIALAAARAADLGPVATAALVIRVCDGSWPWKGLNQPDPPRDELTNAGFRDEGGALVWRTVRAAAAVAMLREVV